MKYIILFLLIPALSFCQEEAPKKATTILVRTAATMDTIEMVLFQRGFTIDNKNDRLGIVVTKPRALKGVQGSVIARILLKDSVATITGEVSLDMEAGFGGAITVTAKNSFSQVKNTGAKNSAMKNSWYAIYNIAKQLGTELTFK